MDTVDRGSVARRNLTVAMHISLFIKKLHRKRMITMLRRENYDYNDSDSSDMLIDNDDYLMDVVKKHQRQKLSQETINQLKPNDMVGDSTDFSLYLTFSENDRRTATLYCQALHDQFNICDLSEEMMNLRNFTVGRCYNIGLYLTFISHSLEILELKTDVGVAYDMLQHVEFDNLKRLTISRYTLENTPDQLMYIRSIVPKACNIVLRVMQCRVPINTDPTSSIVNPLHRLNRFDCIYEADADHRILTECLKHCALNYEVTVDSIQCIKFLQDEFNLMRMAEKERREANEHKSAAQKAIAQDLYNAKILEADVAMEKNNLLRNALKKIAEDAAADQLPEHEDVAAYESRLSRLSEQEYERARANRESRGPMDREIKNKLRMLTEQEKREKILKARNARYGRPQFTSLLNIASDDPIFNSTNLCDDIMINKPCTHTQLGNLVAVFGYMQRNLFVYTNDIPDNFVHDCQLRNVTAISFGSNIKNIGNVLDQLAPQLIVIETDESYERICELLKCRTFPKLMRLIVKKCNGIDEIWSLLNILSITPQTVIDAAQTVSGETVRSYRMVNQLHVANMTCTRNISEIPFRYIRFKELNVTPNCIKDISYTAALLRGHTLNVIVDPEHPNDLTLDTYKHIDPLIALDILARYLTNVNVSDKFNEVRANHGKVSFKQEIL